MLPAIGTKISAPLARTSTRVRVVAPEEQSCRACEDRSVVVLTGQAHGFEAAQDGVVVGAVDALETHPVGVLDEKGDHGLAIEVGERELTDRSQIWDVGLGRFGRDLWGGRWSQALRPTGHCLVEAGDLDESKVRAEAIRELQDLAGRLLPA